MRPPLYLAKIINLSGTVIASPLPAANVTFTRRLALPGQQQLGSFSIDLHPARGSFYHYDEIYRQLDYKQRVEIYEDKIEGDPIFSGRIEDLPSDLGREAISGNEYLGVFTDRRLHHYQTFDGQIDGSIAWLLYIWYPYFKDNFNRTTPGSNWSIVSGGWTISGNRLVSSTSVGEIRHSLGSVGTEFRCQSDFLTGASDEVWTRQFIVFRGGTNPWVLSIQHVDTTDEFVRFTLSQAASSTTIQRDASTWELPFEELATVDFWIKQSGLTQIAEVWLNGRQFLVESSTYIGNGGSLALMTA